MLIPNDRTKDVEIRRVGQIRSQISANESNNDGRATSCKLNHLFYLFHIFFLCAIVVAHDVVDCSCCAPMAASMQYAFIKRVNILICKL